MNTSVIRYLLGYILKLEGFLLLLPCIVAGIYYEKSGIYFLIVALISIAIGFLFSAKKPRVFYLLPEGGLYNNRTGLGRTEYIRLSAVLHIRRDSKLHRCSF